MYSSVSAFVDAVVADPKGNIVDLYFATTGVQIIIGWVLTAVFGYSPRTVEKFIRRHGVFHAGILIVIVGPLIEEGLSRAAPLALFGVWGVAVGTAVWVLGHGKRVLHIAPTAPMYYLLWANGAWKTAIAVHIIHNGWIFGAYLLLQGLKQLLKPDKDTVDEYEWG